MQEIDIAKESLYKYCGRTWVEVDLKQFRENILNIKAMLNEDTQLIPVLKANAYEHGALELARELVQMESQGEISLAALAVASVDEGIFLREHGIKKTILLLSASERERFAEAIENDLTLAIVDYDFARDLSQVAESIGKVAKGHIALDTGMGRVGFKITSDKLMQASLQEVLAVNKLPRLEINGMFTHYATAAGHDFSGGRDSASSAEEFFFQQFAAYKNFARLLEANNVHIPLKHSASSAALCVYPESQLDAVRPGIVMYGVHDVDPSNIKTKNLASGIQTNENLAQNGCNEKDSRLTHLAKIRPILTWKTRVLQVKRLAAGDSVGYDRHFVAAQSMLVAVLPVGYADGYRRSMARKAKVNYKGEICPVIGNICMDIIVIDCSKLDFVPQVGDEVILMGTDLDENSINVNTLAAWQDTISYEVFTSISQRVLRIYLNSAFLAENELRLCRF